MNPIGIITSIVNVGKFVHKVLGSTQKGKMTLAGVITAAAGLGITTATGQNPFESARIIIDLCEKAWPHVLIVIGAITALMGYFRKAGADAATAGLVVKNSVEG